MKPVPPGYVYVDMSATINYTTVNGSFASLLKVKKGIIRVEPDLFDSEVLTVWRARQNAELEMMREFIRSDGDEALLTPTFHVNVFKFEYSHHYPAET